MIFFKAGKLSTQVFSLKLEMGITKAKVLKVASASINVLSNCNAKAVNIDLKHLTVILSSKKFNKNTKSLDKSIELIKYPTDFQ
jgi:hypothetical protein